jgi:hypothetical protein
MDREEFKKFLKMIQAMGITDYKINDHHVRLINQSYVYMIVDKEPDYADDESLRVIKGLMRDSHLLKEPNFKESEFNELLLTFNHISKYKRRVERQVRFVIGNVDNSVVIGHVDLTDDDIESDTNIEILEKLTGSDEVTSFDAGIINDIISFIGFFKYSGTSSGFITLRFKEGMPLIIDKDRFRIYIAPMDRSDDLAILKKIKDSISNGLKNISQFESDE